MPVGGIGTHAVLSGHTGLPSAKLFTDLDVLEVGDLFYIYCLNEVLTYEVDQITIVEPHEIEDLLIDMEHDYVSLVTCTPYGVNSHRLLVRGTRVIEQEDEQIIITEEKKEFPIIYIVILIVLGIEVLLLG